MSSKDKISVLPKILKPDKEDPFKIRRFLALSCSLYALILIPNVLLCLSILFQISTDLVNTLLMYIGTLSAGPIGVYLWGINKEK